MKEIAYHSDPERAKVQSVLLLTDGVANEGEITKAGILAQMLKIQNSQEKKAAKRVTVHTCILISVLFIYFTEF